MWEADLLGQNKDIRIWRNSADEMEPASEMLFTLMTLLFKVPVNGTR